MAQVRLLRDVAKIELGGENYDVIAKFNGQSGLGIKLATGANALDTATAIFRAELKNGTVLPARDENRPPV